MRRRLEAVALVACLLLSVIAATPVSAQENTTASTAEFPSCDSVRITGDAGFAEVHVSIIEQGGFDTELRSIELSGNETVLDEDDLYPNGVGSYQGEFIVAAVTLYESQSGSAIGTFEHPNRETCFEALPRPPEDTDNPPNASVSPDPTTVTSGDPVTFDASGTTDDNGIAEYRWDFDGDGTVDRTTSDATVGYTYTSDGVYDATVTAVDTSDQVSQRTVQITVSPPDTTEPTTTPPDTETTTPPDTATTTPPDTATTTPPDTATTTPPDTATTTPPQSTTPTTQPQDTAPATTPQNPEPAQEGDSGADNDAGGAERTNVSFSANASSDINETLVTYNVTGSLVNASDNSTVTAEESEQAPNTTRAPAVEDDGFEALSYLTVNGTVNETKTENLSVDAAVNESNLTSLDGSTSDVQIYAWDAENDSWISLNTSVTNTSDNTTVANTSDNTSIANASDNTTIANATNVSHVFEADLGYGVYTVGLDRSNFVVTEVTAPENVSVGEQVTVEATVENTGRANGTHTASLSVAGEQVEESEVTLAANESAVVRFDWQFETAGTHTVAIDDQTVDVNVSTAEGRAASPPDDPSADSMAQPRASGSLGSLDSSALVVLLSLVSVGLVAYRRAYR